MIDEGKFVFRLPNPDDSGAKRLDAELTANYVALWADVVEALTRLRKVPQYFIGVSQKTVGEACAELARGQAGSGTPADEQAGDDLSGVVDRAVAGGREDGQPPSRRSSMNRRGIFGFLTSWGRRAKTEAAPMD